MNTDKHSDLLLGKNVTWSFTVHRDYMVSLLIIASIMKMMSLQSRMADWAGLYDPYIAHDHLIDRIVVFTVLQEDGDGLHPLQ
jgi:hypothetical protein